MELPARRDASRQPIRRCPRCHAYVNTQEIEDILQRQVRFHEDWWGNETSEDLQRERDNLTSLADFVIEHAGGADKTILEVGFGRGCLLSALQNAGVSAHGLEPSPELYEKAVTAFRFSSDSAFNIDANIFLRDHPAASYDCLVLWHVLEHLEDPAPILDSLSALVADDGVMIFQTPLPRPDYIYPEHLFFPTLGTFDFFAENLGFRMVHYSFDIENCFLTTVLKKISFVPLADEDITFPALVRDLGEYLPHVRALKQEKQNYERDCGQLRARIADLECEVDQLQAVIDTSLWRRMRDAISRGRRET